MAEVRQAYFFGKLVSLIGITLIVWALVILLIFYKYYPIITSIWVVLLAQALVLSIAEMTVRLSLCGASKKYLGPLTLFSLGLWLLFFVFNSSSEVALTGKIIISLSGFIISLFVLWQSAKIEKY